MKNVRALLSQTQPGAESSQAPSLHTAHQASSSFVPVAFSLFDRGSPATTTSHYGNAKNRIHQRLLEKIDMSAVLRLKDEKSIQDAIETAIAVLIETDLVPLSSVERECLRKDVLNEVLGLGPLEPLLNDPDINDILVNGYDVVWIDRDGKLERTDLRFQDEEHLLHVINRIVARIGRRVDESSPIVDARLPDGSRVNAVVRPLSLDGPYLSIRRFRQKPFGLEDLIERKTMNTTIAQFLSLAVQARLNILVSGGTSARQHY